MDSRTYNQLCPRGNATEVVITEMTQMVSGVLMRCCGENPSHAAEDEKHLWSFIYLFFKTQTTSFNYEK